MQSEWWECGENATVCQQQRQVLLITTSGLFHLCAWCLMWRCHCIRSTLPDILVHLLVDRSILKWPDETQKGLSDRREDQQHMFLCIFCILLLYYTSLGVNVGLGISLFIHPSICASSWAQCDGGLLEPLPGQKQGDTMDKLITGPAHLLWYRLKKEKKQKGFSQIIEIMWPE